jgi:hypothetical protein
MSRAVVVSAYSANTICLLGFNVDAKTPGKFSSEDMLD